MQDCAAHVPAGQEGAEVHAPLKLRRRSERRATVREAGRWLARALRVCGRSAPGPPIGDLAGPRNLIQAQTTRVVVRGPDEGRMSFGLHGRRSSRPAVLRCTVGGGRAMPGTSRVVPSSRPSRPGSMLLPSRSSTASNGSAPVLSMPPGGFWSVRYKPILVSASYAAYLYASLLVGRLNVVSMK